MFVSESEGIHCMKYKRSAFKSKFTYIERRRTSSTRWRCFPILALPKHDFLLTVLQQHIFELAFQLPAPLMSI